MKNDDKMNNLFQVGVILGRITQLSVDRGVVKSGTGMGLSDFLNLLPEQVKNLPMSDTVIGKILGEIRELSTTLVPYPPNVRLEPDDARIMIGLVSRWTGMLYDELSDSTGSASQPETEGGDNRMQDEGTTLQSDNYPAPETGKNDPSDVLPFEADPSNKGSLALAPKTVK